MKTITHIEPTTLATALVTVQGQIKILEEREDELKAELLQELKRQGVQSVKLDDGTQYIRNQRTTVKVKDEAKAWKWAMENPEARLKVDTAAALEVFRKALKMPSYFAKSTTEFLSIKKPKEHDPA